MERFVPISNPPANLKFPSDLSERIRIDKEKSRLVHQGFMSKAEFDRLCARKAMTGSSYYRPSASRGAVHDFVHPTRGPRRACSLGGSRGVRIRLCGLVFSKPWEGCAIADARSHVNRPTRTWAAFQVSLRDTEDAAFPRLTRQAAPPAACWDCGFGGLRLGLRVQYGLLHAVIRPWQSPHRSRNT